MRILITGSKGLIGSALKICLQNLQIETTGIDLNEPVDHLDHGTILDREDISSRIKNCDGIVHLAAVSRVIFGEKFPKLCWETNVIGTQNILEEALDAEQKPWVLYASSREVYGENKSLPVDETAPLKPVNIYGESKLKAEELTSSFSQKGLITGIVRFSNVFGSVHDHADRVIPAFCRAAALGEEIRVDGKDNLFDFTYIDDVVHGILAFIRLLSSKEGSIAPIHFTSGIPYSLGQVAKIAAQASNHPIQIREHPSRSFDVSKFCGDPRRARRVLDWNSTTPVKEGMKRLINQYLLFQNSFAQIPSYA